MNALIQKAKYLLKTTLWILSGYLGKEISLESTQKLTVLITYFNPLRMEKINHQIRNILKCNFVERVIISNHNPDIQIQDKIRIKDERLAVMNQPVKRGCGFRWRIADRFNFNYLIVIDDDFLLSPRQLAALFKYLMEEPAIPHGLSGMNYLSSDEFEFRDRENTEVDFLCEVYAVTRRQLTRYMEINSQISSSEAIARSIDATADFMVISQTGVSKPKIHDVGRLVRDETFKMEGVAVHKDGMFDENVRQVLKAIQRSRLIEQEF